MRPAPEMTIPPRLGAVLLAAAALLLPWAVWLAFGQPKGEVPDPPIIIGDGSILLRIGKETEFDELVWTRWTYHAPPGHEQEALTWSAPGNKSVQGIKEKGSASPGPMFRRLGAWGGLLVVRYTDGTILQVRARETNGKGLTLISSRPLRDYRREGNRVLRFGDSTGPHVSEAYVQTTKEKIPLCQGRKAGECTIEITYK